MPQTPKVIRVDATPKSTTSPLVDLAAQKLVSLTFDEQCDLLEKLVADPAVPDNLFRRLWMVVTELVNAGIVHQQTADTAILSADKNDRRFTVALKWLVHFLWTARAAARTKP